VVLLSDLVALRQVCVHVVLPVKLHLPRDLAIQRYSTLQSLLKTFFVQHGQSAWKSTVQVRKVCVGLLEVRSPRGREKLVLCVHLAVELEADHQAVLLQQFRGL
jgi:hypothetical protein